MTMNTITKIYLRMKYKTQSMQLNLYIISVQQKFDIIAVLLIYTKQQITENKDKTYKGYICSENINIKISVWSKISFEHDLIT